MANNLNGSPSPVRSAPSAGPRDDDGALLIEFGAIPNARGKGSGFLPMVWVNGKTRLDSWRTHGFDKAEALSAAREFAAEERARYVGDWTITVQERA